LPGTPGVFRGWIDRLAAHVRDKQAQQQENAERHAGLLKEPARLPALALTVSRL
jgi:hypothetical protein